MLLTTGSFPYELMKVLPIRISTYETYFSDIRPCIVRKKSTLRPGITGNPDPGLSILSRVDRYTFHFTE